MMTFLPLEDFLQSALSLDDKRLQNQRTEARFVLEWLEGRGFELEAYGAARMWKGYRDALAAYYNACLEAYEARGKTNGPTMPRAAVPKRPVSSRRCHPSCVCHSGRTPRAWMATRDG